MKYAIFECGGKQYRASAGETVVVDRLPLEVGDEVEIKDVLLISNDGKVKVGTPRVPRAKVVATVAEQFKGKKIIVFKYKPAIRYRRKQGHRQQYTRLKIEKVNG